MATLETLQARLESLDASIASGIQALQHGETKTGFRPMDEMQEARASVVRQIAEIEGRKPTRLRYAYQSGKGL